ncbi:hypothetical protein [Sphingobacterium sp. SYP-B4668]|uniref:hypothetical protein n=1 Tax=Sphingobacterium sp. SYP-B4668 TaxID=2996035 RepID=UPI0012E087E9|nr:hypothetical protein [Sphingobacterium sp. SYP-B4668]
MYRPIVFIVCLITSVCLFNSCISRLSRPAITGYIYDYDNKPVANCRVGETQTDENGKFYLKEIRTNRFLLTEIFAMEAPPIFFTLDIEKEGYKSYSTNFFHKYGGGRAKGALDNLDTVYIKRINETILPENYLYTDWHFAANKDLDTLYGINKNYNMQNPITNTPHFDSKFHSGMIYKFTSSTKPDSAWNPESYDLETTYWVSLREDGLYEGKKTLKYLNPWRHRMEYDRTYREAYTIPSDSTTTKGTFTFLNNTIRFDRHFTNSNTLYSIDSIDRDMIILTKIKGR